MKLHSANEQSSAPVARRGFLYLMLGGAVCAAPCKSYAAVAITRINVNDFGVSPGKDARPAIIAALAKLKAMGGGVLVMPKIGGYQISDTVLIDFSNCTIELSDTIALTKRTKASAILFSGQFKSPISNVGITGIGARQIIDGNGKSMAGYNYSIADTYYSAVLFRWCDNWQATNIHTRNGLVNCLRAFQCGWGAITDCDASFAVYDNGHSVDFNPPYRKFSASDPKTWSRARIIRSRVWNCNGLGIASYAATGVVVSDAHVWLCGNDVAEQPNNGGGISLEGNFTKVVDPAIPDYRCVIIRAKIENCYNQGIHISAHGSRVVNSTVTGTKAPKQRVNRLGLYGSNVVVLGKGSVTIEGSTLSDAGLHGIVALAAEGFTPDISFDGSILRSAGHGIYGRNVGTLVVTPASVISQSGATPDRCGVKVERAGFAVRGYGNTTVLLSGRVEQSAGPAIAVSSAGTVRLTNLTLTGNRRLAPAGPVVTVALIGSLSASNIINQDARNRSANIVLLDHDIEKSSIANVKGTAQKAVVGKGT